MSYARTWEPRTVFGWWNYTCLGNLHVTVVSNLVTFTGIPKITFTFKIFGRFYLIHCECDCSAGPVSILQNIA